MFNKIDLKVEVQVLRKENELLKTQISDLQEQRQQLMNQNKQLQEALVSRTAPQAYMDHRMKDYDSNHPDEFKKPKDPINEFLTKYEREIEKPCLFDSAEDMVEKLTRVNFAPNRGSTHQNEES